MRPTPDPRRPTILLLLLAIAGCGPSPTMSLPTSRKNPDFREGRVLRVQGRPLADVLKEARPGDRIELGEGTFEGGLTLPHGVSLAGEGPSKTIIEARGRPIGIEAEGSSGAEVVDLSVRNAGQADLSIRGGSDFAIRRVRASGSIAGIRLAGVARGRVENSVASGNRYGIVAGGGEGLVVVNCSMVGNEGLGLSLPSGSKAVAFNNLIVDGSVGVYLGEKVDARLDHNLYFTQFVGKQAGQVGRKSIGDWYALTGQDARSVRLPVQVPDVNRPEVGPDRATDWDPSRRLVDGWGAAKFEGIEAPRLDIDRKDRGRRSDVGAYQYPAPVPSGDPGTFAIKEDGGLKSAGIFAPDGRLVSYLFHNLPMARGEHSFQLPARDFQGRPISEGSYEVRVVESDLKWEYLGHVGDTGASSPASSTAPVNPLRSAFLNPGYLVMQQGWSEDGANLRGYDATNGRVLWAFEGRSDTSGLAVGGDGAAYSLRPSGSQGQVTRIDPRTGKVAPVEGWRGGQFSFEGWSKASALAEMDGRLYVADGAGNRIRFGPIDRPTLDGQFEVPAPTGLAVDPARKILWAISGDRLMAFEGDGRKVAEGRPVASPLAIAARGGRLAVASGSTGQVHLFDTSDPADLRPIGVLGKPDGPAGPIAPDRFGFRSAEGWAPSHVGLALGPRGELAVAERYRLTLFEPDGTVRWSTFGVFGNETRPSHSDPRRVYDTDGRVSFRLDEVGKTWAPEASRILPAGGAEFLGDFAAKGGVFGVVLTANASAPSRDATLYRLDGARPRAVSALIRDPSSKRYLSLVDANADGRVDLDDRRPDTPSLEGPGEIFGRDTTLLADGSLLTPGSGGSPPAIVVPLADPGLSTVPRLDLERRRAVPRFAGGLVSPYNLQPEPSVDVTAATPAPDGGIIANARLKSSPGGVGLFNNAGTDLIRFDAQGRPLWLHPLERHQGIEGLSTVGPITIAGVGVTTEILAFDPDGLGLGSFGPGPGVHYEGYFLDHPGAVRAYLGPDGRTYALIADNYGGRHHWWRLSNEKTVTSTRRPIQIDAATATGLLARDAPRPRTLLRPSTPVVHIPRLFKDLDIDGDPAKWREAGITPQILVTPETSSGAIHDPRDMSALVRLAYRGDDLYAQFLQFDDVVTFHQPVARHYQQDGVELILNGFGNGFKFDATRTVDAGPIVIRSRFYLTKLDALLKPDQTPRSIRVLDARDVPERVLIESVYGVDLSNCRVIATEFKLPIDAETYKGSPETLIPMKPGQTFRLGLLINDNDEPGSDLQHYLVWPATYSNFGPVEDGALVILD